MVLSVNLHCFRDTESKHTDKGSVHGCLLIAGKLPPRATRLVREWAKIHKAELMNDWAIAQKEGKLKTIEPLL